MSNSKRVSRKLLDELAQAAFQRVEEARQIARERPTDDDVPRIWWNHYYLRHSYHRVATGFEQYDHWEGGPTEHQGAICDSCQQPLHLMWNINARDPRFSAEYDGVFGGLNRLPLYYCCRCPEHTIYRIVNDERIEVLPVDSASYEETPFTDFPEEFARRPLSLAPVPHQIENLTLLSAALGNDWLHPDDRSQLEAYYRALNGEKWLEIRHSQFGGLPVMEQGPIQEFCPNPECPTHAWGNPITRNKKRYRLKLLAVIDTDAGFDMKTSCAQIVFHTCWCCNTVHGSYQID